MLYLMSGLRLLNFANCVFFRIPPLVSPKIPHVPLGVGGWPLVYTKNEDVGLIVRAISFQDF